MSPQLLYSLQQTLPFSPLDLFLADGRMVRVEKAEFLSTADDGQSFILFIPPGIREYLDPALIVSAQVRET